MRSLIQRWLPGAFCSAAASNRPRIGDRLQQLPVQLEWEVVACFKDHDGIPHARICNLDDRRTTKVLACTALLNRRQFRAFV